MAVGRSLSWLPVSLQWISDLASRGLLPETYRPGIRVYGTQYGPNQATFAEIIDDVLPLSIVVLRADQPAAGQTAENAVKDAEDVASAIWRLAREHRPSRGRRTEIGCRRLRT